ncbi:unnamed protein product, partial [marine sediment metagenome]
ELYAAQAYITKAPESCASIRGLDISKSLSLIIIIIGIIFTTLGSSWIKEILTL